MKNYHRVMLGPQSIYFEECLNGNFIGTDYGINQDLKSDLSLSPREFNKKFVPIYLKNLPAKTKVAAGLSCGALYTVSKGIKKGEIVLCPNGSGTYYIGEVTSEYFFEPNDILPHRRSVKWYSQTIERSEMSQALKYSTGSIGAVSDITKYVVELEKLIGNDRPVTLISTDDTVEDPSVFALEEHLEHFLFQNWKQTEIGKNYDIYEVEGEIVGKQFRTDDNGRIDILAISKDKKELLVIELKRGRASDNVVGQIQRYMGYVLEEIAENQTVKGMIIALEDDLKIRRALAVTNNIEFYTYQVSFKLTKNK